MNFVSSRIALPRPARFVLTAALLSAASVTHAQQQDDALAARVDARMEQILARYPVPGASIAIA